MFEIVRYHCLDGTQGSMAFLSRLECEVWDISLQRHAENSRPSTYRELGSGVWDLIDLERRDILNSLCDGTLCSQLGS